MPNITFTLGDGFGGGDDGSDINLTFIPRGPFNSGDTTVVRRSHPGTYAQGVQHTVELEEGPWLVRGLDSGIDINFDVGSTAAALKDLIVFGIPGSAPATTLSQAVATWLDAQGITPTTNETVAEYVTTGPTKAVLDGAYATAAQGGLAETAIQPTTGDRLYSFRSAPGDPRICQLATGTIVASPTVTAGSSAPSGWSARRVHSAPVDGSYWSGFRVSGGPCDTSQRPMGIVSATPQYASTVEFDVDVPTAGLGFALEVECKASTYMQVFLNESRAHSAPQQTTALGGGTGNRKIAYALAAGYYRVRVEMYNQPNSSSYMRSIYTHPTVGVFAPSIQSRRLHIIGDSYSAAIGTTLLASLTPDYGRAYSLTLGKLLGIADTWNWGAIPGTGFIGNGSGSTSTQTHLAKAQAALTYMRDGDLVVVQGSINDGSASEGAILAAVAAVDQCLKDSGLRLQVIYTSPLYMRDRPTGPTDAYTRTIAAYETLGLTWVDVFGAEERLFSGSGNVAATTGDGNADYYAADESPSPSQHPSNAGHDALARALASRIMPLL
jgi:lysophospholipase L1-like esterase